MTDTLSLTINGNKINALAGQSILWAAMDNDIYIPNLCAIREVEGPFAACRLCFVEVEGQFEPLV